MNQDATSLTTEQLIEELKGRKRELFTSDGLVILPLYELITQLRPLPCIDVIPVKKTDAYQLGVIVRATGDLRQEN